MGEVRTKPPNAAALTQIRIPQKFVNRRLMYRELNPLLRMDGYAPICWDTSDPNTVSLAFAGRLLRVVPTPVEKSLVEFGKFVDRYIVEHDIPVVTHYSFEEWLHATPYTQSRKEDLLNVWKRLEGGYPTREVSRKVNCFVKTESYVGDGDEEGLRQKFPRMIMSRVDEAKVTMGPAFKAIEEKIFAMPWFIKHVPVPDRPAMLSDLYQTGCKYYESDFTAFESSFCWKVMITCEMKLYKHMLQNFPRMYEYIETTLTGMNYMSTRHGVRVKVSAKRCSGEMNTSLGNGITNLLLNLYVAEQNGSYIKGYVEGDDGIFAVSTLPTSEQFEVLGFSIKIKEVDHPKLASFCGILASGNDIVRDPSKFLMNFNYSHSCVHATKPSVYMGLLRAKALSAMYETPNSPIISELAYKALEMTRGFDPRFIDDGYHIKPPCEMKISAPNVTPESRMLVAEAFGIPEEDQILIEGLIRSERFAEIPAWLPPPQGSQEMYALYVE